jgi:primosomal protein N' (replication factor Y)
VKIARVYTSLKHFSQAYYLVDDGKVGDWVFITIKNKKSYGLICEIVQELPNYPLKTAEKTQFNVSLSFVKYIEEFAFFNLLSTCYIIKHISGLLPKKNNKPLQKTYKFALNNLNDEQQKAYEFIKKSNKISVLWGVTGSGKTEVFLHLIQDVVNRGGQVLVLMPEIALSEVMSVRFAKALGIEPVIWNSSCKNKSKFFRILTENSLVVLGSRCSVLLPFKNLQLIIVDEEHDKSYKQDNQYAYNSRNMSILRGKIENAKVILSSATPSMETFYKIQKQEYDCVRLHGRFGLLSTPIITIKHLQDDVLCPYVIQRCKEELLNKKQILFFLNRRGYAYIVKCKKCKNRLQCACESMLVFHKNVNQLICHRCNKTYSANYCFLCNKYGCLFSFGIGVQMLQEYINDIFNIEPLVLSSENILTDLNKVYDSSMIIGTQVLAKGHNFPQLSLVVMVNVDGSNFDFRSSENSLQILFQVAGRAGRGQMEFSEVIIQTYRPIEQLNYLMTMNYESFLQNELKLREKWRLPPFTRLIALRFTDNKLIPEYIKCIHNLSCQIIGPLEYHKRTSIILRVENTKFISTLEFLRTLPMQNVLVDVGPEEIL